jgi:polyhydroxybutyrate depolymerase
MRGSKIGLVGSLLLTFSAVGCGNDDKPATNTPSDGGMVDDGGGNADVLVDITIDTPEGDKRPCEGSTIKDGNGTFTYNGVEFSYIVHLPPSYDGTKRTPLVVNWHGRNSNASEQQFFSGMNPVADENDFIVVYMGSPDKTWNAGTCCELLVDGGDLNRDDVGLARAIVAEFSKTACIDAKKIYSIGMSNGGFMSHRLGCEASDLFAAVASVAGMQGLPTCTPDRPMPIIEFHGTGDTTISYTDSLWSAEGAQSVPEMMQRWATRDGCMKGPQKTYENGIATCQTWSDCNGGVLVSLCTSEGVAHCWPGNAFCPNGMVTTTDIDAAREGWRFLQQFALP